MMSSCIDPVAKLAAANFVERRHQQQQQLDQRPPVLRQQPQAPGKPIKIRKKKVPVLKHIRPNFEATPSNAPLASDTIMEGANNRTEDEKRCEFTDMSQLFEILNHYHTYYGFFLSLVLSLFTIVSFQNLPCVSGSGNNGTCYSSSDCSNLGGSASGSCASGFGVCCLCELKHIF
jgi:hypothetical protein